MASRFFKPVLKNERAIFLPFVALMIIALLGLAGLAIDGAFLYLRKQMVQNATDAAATKCAQLLLESPADYPSHGSGAGRDQHIVTLAKEIVRENLHQNGYDSPPPLVTVDPSNKRDKITVDAVIQSANYLITVLPGGPKTTRVSAESSGENVRLRVVLVLDASSSMHERMTPPANCADCTDIENGKAKKLHVLKHGAKLFLNGLSRSDQVAIVRFATRYDRTVCNNGTNCYTAPSDVWRYGLWGNDADIVTKNIPTPEIKPQSVLCQGATCTPDGCTACGTEEDSFGPEDALIPLVTSANRGLLSDFLTAFSDFGSGMTNIPVGILMGQDILDADRPSNDQNVRDVIVLVTDGAPFGFNAKFDEQFQEGGDWCGGHRRSRLEADKSGKSLHGECQEWNRDTTVIDRSNGCVAPGSNDFDAPYFRLQYDDDKECLDYLLDQTSGSPTRGYVTNTDLPSLAEFTRRRLFTDTLIATRKSLIKGTTIYTIGLGDPDNLRPGEANNPSLATPYQCGMDEEQLPGGRHFRGLLKHGLLTFMSHDTASMTSPFGIGQPRSFNRFYSGGREGYPWDFPCITPAHQMPATTPQGLAFIASDGDSLVQAFQRILNTRVSLFE